MNEEIKQEELNNKAKKNKQNNNLVFSGRFSNPDDIYLLNKYIANWKKEGKSSYQEINNIVRNSLLEQEKQEGIRNIKNDLFYALRKANWASLSPYAMQNTRKFREVDIELSIINLKLNMLLNLLFDDKLENELDNPSAKFLKEPDFFKNTIRGSMAKINDKWTNTIAKKLMNGKKAFDDFLAQLSENEFDDIMNEISILNNDKNEEK